MTSHDDDADDDDYNDDAGAEDKDDEDNDYDDNGDDDDPNWHKLLLTESACKPAGCHLIHTASFDHCPMTIMTMAMFWIMLDRCIDASMLMIFTIESLVMMVITDQHTLL